MRRDRANHKSWLQTLSVQYHDCRTSIPACFPTIVLPNQFINLPKQRRRSLPRSPTLPTPLCRTQRRRSTTSLRRTLRNNRSPSTPFTRYRSRSSNLCSHPAIPASRRHRRRQRQPTCRLWCLGCGTHGRSRRPSRCATSF
jgi:hypothetical protein